MSEILKIILLTCFVFGNSSSLYAAKRHLAEDSEGNIKKIAEDDKGIFTFVLDNDLFTGTDLGYTNGIRISYLSSEEKMPFFIRNASSYLPILNSDGKKRVGIAFGQNMYTPRDIEAKEFIPNDFLYAGWFYGSLGIISDKVQILDNVVLTLGVVGPSSHAEQTQKFVHHVLDVSQPRGWSNQLKDEPGFILTYERKWREILEAKPFGIGVDAIPHLGMNLGNVNTSATAGATFRLGYDLPSDYGPPRINPSLPGSDFFIPTQKVGGYLFSIIEVRAVARNIFLDGNTFRTSPSLDKEVITGRLEFGGSIIFKNSRLSYTHVLSTKQFKKQKEHTQFGGITYSYRF